MENVLFLGHMGIGYTLSWRWVRDLPTKWVIFGTVLPDLIDKPLYYGLCLIEGKKGEELGLICSTRTIGHSGILLTLLVVTAIARGSRKLMAVSIGVITHLLLDTLGDSFELLDQSATIHSILMPFLHPTPAVHPDILSHARAYVGWNYSIVMEMVGFILLSWIFRIPIRQFIISKFRS